MVRSDKADRVKTRERPIGLASPMARLASFVLDLILLFPLIRLLQAPFQRELMTASLLEQDNQIVLFRALSAIVFFLIFVLYHGLLTYWRGQTLGKMFFGVQVVSTVGHISLWSAFSRALFLFFGLGLAYLPFLAIFYHPMRRCFHDRISDTLVVGLRGVVSWPQSHERRSSFLLMTGTLGLCLISFLSVLFLTPQLPLPKGDLSALCSEQWGERRDLSLQAGIERLIDGSISANCLEELAQAEIWEEEAKPLPKLALAFAYLDEAEKSDRYLKSVCLSHPGDRQCVFVSWLTKQTRSEEFISEGVDQLLADPELENFARFFLARYALDHGETQIAELSLQGIHRPAQIGRSFAQLQLELLLQQGQLESAFAFYQGHFLLTEDELAALIYRAVQEQRLDQAQVLKRVETLLSKRASQSEEQRMPASDSSAQPLSSLDRLCDLLRGL